MDWNVDASDYRMSCYRVGGKLLLLLYYTLNGEGKEVNIYINRRLLWEMALNRIDYKSVITQDEEGSGSGWFHDWLCGY